MTQEVSEEDRIPKMFQFFIKDGVESIRLLLAQAREEFNITPPEFYGILISLLESFTKCFTTNCDTKMFKGISNDKKRQKLVDFFDKAFIEFYSEQIN